MKTPRFALTTSLSLLCMLFATQLAAQERFFGVDLSNDGPYPAERPAAETGTDSNQYLTAREMIQRRAAWQSEQRRARIAAAKRMGYSPSRPPVSPIPSMSGPNYPQLRVYYAYPGRMFIGPAGPPRYQW